MPCPARFLQTLEETTRYFSGDASAWSMVGIPFTAKDGTRVVFREPETEDARSLMEFINSVIEEDMSGIMMDKKVTLPKERVWLRKILKEVSGRETVMLVVESDGEILGNCHVERHHMKLSHRAMIGIALSKEARGKGIGEALMKATIALTRKRMKGIESIDLFAFDYNKRAQKLYRKLGFVEVGRIPRAVKEGDRYFDELTMVLDLRNK